MLKRALQNIPHSVKDANLHNENQCALFITPKQVRLLSVLRNILKQESRLYFSENKLFLDSIFVKKHVFLNTYILSSNLKGPATKRKKEREKEKEKERAPLMTNLTSSMTPFHDTYVEQKLQFA